MADVRVRYWALYLCAWPTAIVVASCAGVSYAQYPQYPTTSASWQSPQQPSAGGPAFQVPPAGSPPPQQYQLPPPQGASGPAPPSASATPFELPPPAESVQPNATSVNVVDVQILGNDAVPLHKVVPHIKTRAGRPLDLNLVTDDVRALIRSRLFVTVEPSYERVDQGVIVVFRVVERPTIRYVKYVGNHVRDATVGKQTNLKVGDVMDPYTVEEARRTLEEWYLTKGYARARVKTIEGNEPGDRGVVFLINEGKKQRIFKVQFEGNSDDIATDARLKTQIQSKPPILFLFKGEVDREKIEADEQTLTAYYRSLGFFQCRVGYEMDFNEKENWLTLIFVINEGPRSKIRNVAVIGNERFTTEELQAELKLHSGDYFDQAKLNSDVATMQDKYGIIGFVFADVQADPRLMEHPGELDLVYRIDEGERYRVGRINVRINGEDPHTRRNTVLNRVSIRPGDVANIAEIRASERRLRASGLFMVDPANGVQPKILFSPSDAQLEERELAEGPRPNVRGQSPDNVQAYGQVPMGRTDPYATNTGWTATEAEMRPYAVPVQYSQYSGQAMPNTPVPPPAMSPPQVTVPQYAAPQAGAQQYSAPPASAPGQPYYAPSQPPYYAQQQQQQTPPTVQAQPAQSQPVQSAPAYDSIFAAPAVPQPTVTPGAWPVQNGGAPAAESIYPPASPAPGAGYESPGQLFPNGLPPVLSDEPIPNVIDVEVDVTETQTGRFMVGVGVNSDAGVVGSIIIDEQNFDWRRWPRGWEDVRNFTAFRGGGQQFRIEAVPGNQVSRYMFTFRDPYLGDTPVSLSTSAYYFNRFYRNWDEERLGGRIGLGYQFRPDLSGGVAFRGENVNISNPSVPTPPQLLEVLGDNALYVIETDLAHDTRDSTFLATQGHLVRLGFEQGLGEFTFPKVTLEGRQYFLMRERPDGSGRHVLSVSSLVGFTGSNTPIYERFYAGGFSTMRGFNFRGASPLDMNVEVGGDFEWINSLEYLFPITADDMMRGVVFCDFGTVEEDIDIDNFRVSPGFGLRIAVPALGPAPIALDFAVPVVHAPGDNIQNFSFSMGLQR